MNKKCTYSGSNRGPLACEANVITNYTTGAIKYFTYSFYLYTLFYAKFISEINKCFKFLFIVFEEKNIILY